MSLLDQFPTELAEHLNADELRLLNVYQFVKQDAEAVKLLRMIADLRKSNAELNVALDKYI